MNNIGPQRPAAGDVADPGGTVRDEGLAWSDTMDVLSDPSLDPLFWRAERLGSPSAWWEHVPFAHWLICATVPRVLVELGTHAGVSYAAFCQAVVRGGLPTRCHAVDTWRGDSQAGEYGPEIFEELKQYHDERYGSFSTLLRCTFDQALEQIEDSSVDLLHIDGLHTYDAVRNDFDRWLSKLSDRAVVVFHDINERHDDFGVWRLWAELRGRYPAFEFLHGHGLGILAVGDAAPDAVLALCGQTHPASVGRIRQRFATLGEHWLKDARERILQRSFAEFRGSIVSERERLGSECERLRSELGVRGSEIERVTAALAEAEREANASRARSVRAEEALGELRAHAEEAAAALKSETLRTTTLVRQEVLSARARAERAAAAAEAERMRASRAEAVISAAAERAERAETLAQQASAFAQAAVEQKSRAEAALTDVRTDFERVLLSTAWRVTWPGRAVGRHLPKGLRRALRGSAKIAWWTATMKLRRRLKDRQRILREMPPLIPVVAEADPLPALGNASVPPPVAPAASVAEEAAYSTVRIVFISGEPDTPGHIYRVLRPLASAASLGARTSWMAVQEVPDRLAEIESADALIIWRATWNENVGAAIAAARRRGAKVVFDVDDLMFRPELAKTSIIDGIRTQDLTEEMVALHYERIRSTMFSADLCLATTEELAREMRDYHIPATVFPNGLDGASIAASRRAVRSRRTNGAADEIIRLGYAGGSRTHQKDFAQCADAVAAVLRARPDCRLVLFRSSAHARPTLDVSEFECLSGLEAQIEWREFLPLQALPEEIARFDISLAPLEVGNLFCEAKSELKWFEAAAVDVPTIASPTGPYRRTIRHGETGFLAATQAEWETALLALVQDSALRRRVASAARREALWRFGPERRAEDMATLLDLLKHGRSAARAFELNVRRARDRFVQPLLADSDVVFETDRLQDAEVTIVIPLYNYAEYVTEALEFGLGANTPCPRSCHRGRPLD